MRGAVSNNRGKRTNQACGQASPQVSPGLAPPYAARRVTVLLRMRQLASLLSFAAVILISAGAVSGAKPAPMVGLQLEGARGDLGDRGEDATVDDVGGRGEAHVERGGAGVDVDQGGEGRDERGGRAA